jgi:hypothetical protein
MTWRHSFHRAWVRRAARTLGLVGAVIQFGLLIALPALAQSRGKVASDSAVEEAKPTASAGAYRLTVEAVRFISENDMQVTFDPAALMRGFKPRVGGEEFADESEGEHGGGKVGGATAFAVGGGGADGKFNMPNLQLQLRIAEPKAAAKKRIFSVEAQYSLTDDLGLTMHWYEIVETAVTFKVEDVPPGTFVHGPAQVAALCH